jgi:hypothetical protein
MKLKRYRCMWRRSSNGYLACLLIPGSNPGRALCGDSSLSYSNEEKGEALRILAHF